MSLTNKIYTPQDHLVWSRMFTEQYEKATLSGIVMNSLVKSLHHIPLPHTTVPDAHHISSALQKATGRTLTDAKGQYLGPEERFTHLLHKRFPVTDYIRSIKDIAFTPLPDLFHEYFGHMPQMFLQQFANMEAYTAQLFFKAKTPAMQKVIYTFSRYSIEYGMVREEGKEKARGAGLLSSPVDLDRVINNQFIYEPATLSGICATPTSPHEPHQKLFVFESIEQVRTMLREIESMIHNAQK